MRANLFIAVLLLVSSVSALTFTRDVVDHVVVTHAVKMEVCETVAPPCEVSEWASPETTSCLYENAFAGDCISSNQSLIFGELTVYEKASPDNTNPPRLSIVTFNDVVYRGDSLSFDYYWLNDNPSGLPDPAKGGEYQWSDGRTGRGVKSFEMNRLDILNPDFEPYGWMPVTPSHFMIYYEPDGNYSVYMNLGGKHYKLVGVKKEVRNKTWTPPETPEPPAAPELKPTETCASQNGRICEYGYWCIAEYWLEASDSYSCCSIECKPPSSGAVTPRNCSIDSETGLEVCQAIPVGAPPGQEPPVESAPPIQQCAFTGTGCCGWWAGKNTTWCASIPPSFSCGAGLVPAVNGCTSGCYATVTCVPAPTPTPSPTPMPSPAPSPVFTCFLIHDDCCNTNNPDECLTAPLNTCGPGYRTYATTCSSNCAVTWDCRADPTPSPSPSPTPSPSPSPSPSPTPSPAPSPEPTPSPSPSPSLTPSSSPGP